MTLPEFIVEEARRDGKEPHELHLEMIDEEQKAYEQEEAMWRIPEFCFKQLTEAVLEWNSYDTETDPIPAIVKVIEVMDVRLGHGRSNETHIKAKCQTVDGAVGILTYDESHSYGSYYEPPDNDMNIVWGVLLGDE